MDTCQDEKVFTFQELTHRAKARALNDSRQVHIDYDWWDDVCTDATHMAELLGVEIEPRTSDDESPKIYFSGFCSQGDGACFSGTYRPKADAIAAVAETNDVELASLAQRLTVVAVTLALTQVEGWSATITTHGHYSHPGTMNVDIEVETEEDCPDAVNDLIQAAEEEIQSCMRSFADWIYAQLETEYEHLTSDETITETLISDETRFDEDGAII